MGQFLTLHPGLMLTPLLSQLYLACRATGPGTREENCLCGREGLLKRLSRERAATKSRSFTRQNQQVEPVKRLLSNRSGRQITPSMIQIPLRTLPEWPQTTTFLRQAE